MTDAADHSTTDSSEPARRELAGLVAQIVDRRRRIAALQAEEAALLADSLAYATARMDAPRLDARAPRDIPIRSVAAEIAAATRMSDRTIQARMNDAFVLVTNFPATWAALSAGTIERSHASVIMDAGGGIGDPAARATFETQVLRVAARETPGRLRPVARRLADRIQPLDTRTRHRRAMRTRGVWVSDLDDGMAEFGIRTAAHLAHAAFDRATQLAHHVLDARGDGPRAAIDEDLLTTLEMDAGGDATRNGAGPDTRTLAEVRADVACDLLLTGHASATASDTSIPQSQAIRGRVQVTVPALSLIPTLGTTLDTATTPHPGQTPALRTPGRAGESAELAGYGPIPIDIAKQLAGHAPGWERILTDPVSGAILACDRYTPTEQMKRMLRARDEHCRFPGCRQPTWRSDIDHTVAAAADGPTSVGNLAHLCRRHHTLQHHSAWRVRQRPGGVLEWTSPSGAVHTDLPAATLRFVAEGPPSGDPPFYDRESQDRPDPARPQRRFRPAPPGEAPF